MTLPIIVYGTDNNRDSRDDKSHRTTKPFRYNSPVWSSSACAVEFLSSSKPSMTFWRFKTTFTLGTLDTPRKIVHFFFLKIYRRLFWRRPVRLPTITVKPQGDYTALKGWGKTPTPDGDDSLKPLKISTFVRDARPFLIGYILYRSARSVCFRREEIIAL